MRRAYKFTAEQPCFPTEFLRVDNSLTIIIIYILYIYLSYYPPVFYFLLHLISIILLFLLSSLPWSFISVLQSTWSLLYCSSSISSRVSHSQTMCTCACARAHTHTHPPTNLHNGKERPCHASTVKSCLVWLKYRGSVGRKGWEVYRG